MFDLLPEIHVFSAIVGAAAGAVATTAGAYVYANRAKIAGLFKRAETAASAEVATVRQALVNLEATMSKGFTLVSSATRQVQADVAAVKGVVADVGARIEKLETAVFGEVKAAITTAQPAPAPVAVAPAQ